MPAAFWDEYHAKKGVCDVFQQSDRQADGVSAFVKGFGRRPISDHITSTGQGPPCAALDRAHHFELAEADMAAQGTTVEWALSDARTWPGRVTY
jgi:hypothetical protein